MTSIKEDEMPVLPMLAMKEATKIAESANGPLHIIKFGMLRSNEDRYNYTRALFQDLDKIFPDVKASAKKCSVKAERLRKEGNKAFGLAQYEKAHELFTQSAGYARPEHVDSDGKNTLALAIANRSGALFFMGKYMESLVDIENALQIGYPEDLKYKLYDRKGKGYLALKSYRAAEIAFELAAALIDKAELPGIKKKSALKQIQKNIEVCIRNKGANVEINLKDLKGKLPIFSDKPNTTHPSLSSACEVEYIPGKGRGIVAARDIKPGEVLLVDKPFASVFKPDKKYKDCCHHCFNPCETLLPCLKCSTARYCSSDCRSLSWETYHKYECGIPLDDLLEEGSYWHLAVRMILKVGLDYLLEFQQKRRKSGSDGKIPEKFKGCNEEGQYLSSDYTSVYHNYNPVPIGIQFSTSFASVLMVKLLEKVGLFDSTERQKKHTARTCVGACLITHSLGQVLPIMHGVPEWEEPKVEKIVGSSLPTTYRLFNHSCDIETSQTWYGDIIVVQALQSYKKGREVTMVYGKSFIISSKEVRQNFLKQEFFFDCSCDPCVTNWPVFQDICHIPTFKCSECEQPLPKPEMDFFQCRRCNLIQSVMVKVESLRSLTELLELARQTDDDVIRLRYIEAIEKLLVQPWINYTECKAELAFSFRKKNSFIYKRYQE